MKKTTVIHVELKISYNASFSDFDSPVERHTTLDELGLKTIEDLHEYVRRDEDFVGYATHEISTVTVDGIEYKSDPLNVSGITWFGKVRRAEDIHVIDFSDESTKGLPLDQRATIPYVDLHPHTRGKIYAEAGGHQETLKPDSLTRVFDRATNAQIWPQAKPAAKPAPAP